MCPYDVCSVKHNRKIGAVTTGDVFARIEQRCSLLLKGASGPRELRNVVSINNHRSIAPSKELGCCSRRRKDTPGQRHWRTLFTSIDLWSPSRHDRPKLVDEPLSCLGSRYNLGGAVGSVDTTRKQVVADTLNGTL